MHRTNNILREDVRSFVDKIHGRSRDIINGDGSQQKITEFAIYDNTSFVISKFSYQILRTLLTNDRLVSIIFQARNKSRAWMESVFLPPSASVSSASASASASSLSKKRHTVTQIPFFHSRARPRWLYFLLCRPTSSQR